MPQLVGEDRRAILDQLVQRFDSVTAGGGPFAVSLESPLGLGKTRLAQELYGRLATSRQGSVPYWPGSLDWHRSPVEETRRDVLQARKQVEPTPGWVVRGGSEIPWLWWGISCQLTHAGMPMRAMKDASDQLRAHLDFLLARVERASRAKDDALEVLSGVFDLVGVVSPGGAIDAGSKFLGVFRRRREEARKLAAASMDRRVEVQGESYAEAGRIADGLGAVARAGTPVVLVVDDAHWADPALVSLLRHLIGLDGAPVLIVTTSSPEKLAEQVGRGAENMAAWLHDTESNRPDRIGRITLGKLDDDALGRIILEAAGRTAPDTAARIAAIASGNPLVLNLLLDLDVIRRDVAADGAIDTDPAELQRLPSNLRVIYQDLWGQLPDPVKRVLALVAVQGPEFLPGFVVDAASRLRMHDELVPAFAAARDTHRWIRAVNEDRYEFSERQRFDIAYDNLREVFSDGQQDAIRAAIVAHILAFRASERWADLDLRTRRLALESHLDVNEQLGEKAERDLGALADTMLQLAAIELDAGNARRAADLAEGSLSVQGQAPTREDLRARAREVLAQALAISGRAEEAVPLLAQLVAEGAPGAEGAAGAGIAEAAELMEELTEDVAVAASAAAVAPAALAQAVPASPDADEWGREPWKGWQPGPIPTLTAIAPSEIAAFICQVVGVEGPVYAGRVYDLLRTASGASRQGRLIRSALDSGVRSAVRRGELVASIPDARGASDRRVLRLPTQPELIFRQVGDRAVEEIPPSELIELARRVLAREPGLSRDELKKRMAVLLGAGAHARSVGEVLEAVLPPSFAVAPAAVARDEWGRAPWAGWEPHAVPVLTDLKPAQAADLVLEVVRAEGPVLAARVFDLLSRASGAGRQGRTIREALDAGVRTAVRRGDLVVTAGRRGDPGSRVLRQPTQPEVLLREPGDRDVSAIPPSELAELARRVESRTPGVGRDELKRQVAQVLGQGRYTHAIDELLGSALPADPGGQ